MSEYIVDFGNSMVMLSRIIESPSARLCGEIVRCRDCAYSIHFFHHDDERWQCTEPYQDGDYVKPDAYCWRGKRKESGE